MLLQSVLRPMHGLSLSEPRAVDGGHAVGVAVPDAAPCCEGHFPGQPVVQASVLLAVVGEALRAAHGPGAVVRRIERARFRRPVVPGDALEVVIERRGEGVVRFAFRRGGESVADGRVFFGGVGP